MRLFYCRNSNLRVRNKKKKSQKDFIFFRFVCFVFVVTLPSWTPARIAQFSAGVVRCFSGISLCATSVTGVLGPCDNSRIHSETNYQTNKKGVKFVAQLHWSHVCAVHRTPLLIVAGSRLQASFRWLHSLARLANAVYVIRGKLANFTRFDRPGCSRCHRNGLPQWTSRKVVTVSSPQTRLWRPRNWPRR